ncbi:MAG: hypothetical protein QME72_07300 [Rhodococcus sp. (in: high G+C Gram-positive bacteria)]|nr:hypothetical protein [Rhodococcus sp. (in: high G+C Gram-positive bacteria)]MDI6627509.1 hypothetical protein [Rhodococcus sp. (in: high G+C Gram-positive bacteria)]
MTATRFDANTPPTADEPIAAEVSDDHDDNLLSADAVQRGNRLAMTDAAQREARLIIGTTHVGAAQRDLRLSEDRARAERTRAEIDAQRGGPSISTSLRGELGKSVSDVLAFSKIDAAYSKVIERVRGEVETIEAEKKSEALILDGLLDAALDASRAKQRTPDVLAPFIQWIEHERPDGRPEGYAVAVFEVLNVRHAAERTERAQESALEIEKLLSFYTQRVLDSAGDVADVLDAAGLSVDATADDVVESNDPAVLTAWREWKSIVQQWSDLQSVRRWLAVAVDSGFDPTKPLELLNDTDAEMVSWRTQFPGVAVEGVEGSHQALKYWLERVRPRL